MGFGSLAGDCDPARRHEAINFLVSNTMPSIVMLMLVAADSEVGAKTWA